LAPRHTGRQGPGLRFSRGAPRPEPNQAPRRGLRTRRPAGGSGVLPARRRLRHSWECPGPVRLLRAARGEQNWGGLQAYRPPSLLQPASAGRHPAQWQHFVATGQASSLAGSMRVPHWVQSPYNPSLARATARLDCLSIQCITSLTPARLALAV
jgi:hypothetical protein